MPRLVKRVRQPTMDKPAYRLPPARTKPGPLLPAALLSGTVHVALILLLSLIILRLPPSTPPLAFTASDVAPLPSLTQIPSVTVEAIADWQPPPLASGQFALELPVDIRPPLAEPPRLSTVAADNDSAAEALSDPLGAKVPGALVVSIQRRVSAAGGQKGEVQFALAWKNTNDVDLHVIAPSGERISHLHRRSACGGMLDVDMNVRAESTTPVENVRWLTKAPAGRYTVIVNLFRIHRPTAASPRVYSGSEFQLLAQLGQETQVTEQTVSRGNQIAVFRFRYVSQEITSAQRERLLTELAQLQAADEASAEPLLQQAQAITSKALRERQLNHLIQRFPHTDAAIEAMRLLGGNISK